LAVENDDLVLTMDADQRDAWNARKMVVTVTDHCEHCKTLKPDVQRREHAQYWPTVSLKLTACNQCFEVAKKAAIDEARAANASYC
jgi:flavoprotein